MSTAAAIATLAEHIGALPEETRAQLDEQLDKELSAVWRPEPGPQLDAYVSPADLLLFGGSAGGGKSDVILGLALTAHERSVVFRRQSTDLEGLWDRLLEISQPIQVSSDSNRKKLRTTDERLIEGGHLDKPRSEFSWQGRAHDFIGFDEGAQISPAKMVFVMGWLRSATGHRCRTVIATNPPMGGDGVYLLEWFAPWLDPMFPNKAEPGELRYAYFEGQGDQITTVWVDAEDVQPGKHPGTHFVMVDGKPKEVRSRSFIPSRLDDNPHLRDTGYRAQLDSLPEPLRSQLLNGDFLSGREDHEWQVIPTAWVYAAQERWKRHKATIGDKRPRMIALSADAAMGGADDVAIAPLCHPAFFEEIIAIPGREVKDGPTLANHMIKARRDGANLSIDMTGGWGASARDHIQTHHKIGVAGIIASEKSGGTAKGNRLAFANKRAELWWRFREALDPDSGEAVMLPPDTRLTAELTAPRYEIRGTSLVVEAKQAIRKRLGSSTDRADAVLQAWSRRDAMPIVLASEMETWPDTAEEDWDAYA